MVVPTVVRWMEGVPLSQWFGLDSWEFVTAESNWVIKGETVGLFRETM